MNLSDMRAKRLELLAKIEELTKGDDTESLVAVVAEAEELDKSISAREAAEALQARLAQPAAKVAKPSVVAPVKPTLSAEGKLDAFFLALPKGDRAIRAAAGDIFEEATDANGGYLVPVDKRQLLSLISTPDTVHGLCDIVTTNSNAITVPVDEDTAWSTSLAAEDVAEGGALTEQEGTFGTLDVSLAKSGVLVRVTTEMLEDNTGIGQYVLNKLGQKLAWKLNSKAIAAFLASPAKVAVPEPAGAATGDAPKIADIQAMWTSMLAPMRSSAVWLANPKLESALQNMVIGQTPVYIPAGGMSEAPYGKLFGRPVLFIEGLPAVGTVGDLILVDPKSFYLLLKTQGPRIESSIHAEFKNDVVQYRGFIRSAVKSKLTGVITRPDSTTAGNVVVLTTRTT